MRFAFKAVPVGVLGCATALLVACGNSNGLLSGGDASSLQDALSQVQSACAAGQQARAARSAQRFSDHVAGLSPRQVDRRLIANLQQGASTLEALVAQTCTATTATTAPTTATTTTSTVPSTATAPTTATTTTPTTTVPSTPTTPTATTPTGDGETPGNGPPGGAPPGKAKKGEGDSGGAGDAAP